MHDQRTDDERAQIVVMLEGRQVRADKNALVAVSICRSIARGELEAAVIATASCAARWQWSRRATTPGRGAR